MEAWAFFTGGAPLEKVPLINHGATITFSTPGGEVHEAYMINWWKLLAAEKEALWDDVKNRIPDADRDEFYAECDEKGLPVRKVRVARVENVLPLREVL